MIYTLHLKTNILIISKSPYILKFIILISLSVVIIIRIEIVLVITLNNKSKSAINS